MKVHPYIKDLQKLIELGFDNNEIRNQIRKKHGIHLELSKIEIKRKSELNNYIKPFLKDSKELLYPILYKGFPPRNSIREKIDQIIYYLIDSKGTINDFPSEKVLEDLQINIRKGLNTYKHDAFLYKLIYQHKEQINKNFEDARAIILLKSQIDDPFNHYFNLSYLNLEHFSFTEESAEFDIIIREVCRDNIITSKERKYLEEKAREYFIDSEKLDRYLNNPFLGYESFKIFVDQICEDGKVTEIENEYINEKAEQYNVPEELLKKMISTGLLRAKFTAQLTQDSDFYEIVLIYLFANAYGLKAVGQRLTNMLPEDVTEHSISYQLKTKKEILFNVMCETAREKKELEALHIYNFENIIQIYDALNIKTVPLAKLIEKGSRVFDDEDKVAKGLITLEWRYTFDPELDKAIHIDYLNKKVTLKNKNNAFNTFLNCLFLERNKHRSPELDLFFENFEEFYSEL